jgi:hypothetical protein
VATKLGIYNGALAEVKERRLSGLTEDTPARYALDEAYDKTILYMLDQGLWRFASRTVALEPSTSFDPEFGYDEFFEKPDDYVRLISLSESNLLDVPLGDFQEDGTGWYANLTTLYCCYVSNASDAGLDLGRWPPSFERAVELELAARIAPHVASMGRAELKDIRGDAIKALRDARSKAAMAGPSRRLPTGRLVRARMGRRVSNSDRQE